ncbi:MAG: MerR family transcriptional regulator [Bifidobacteriaceae bacterium]|jgi:DNA-binding transcriptional MerR regulator|nr:MerR family transcriptional regulator [Bifidobacteriaceae bacterium]
MTGHLLKAGEFARLSGTTKETLRHYRGIGLMSPAVTAPNGYQLYDPVQVADFGLITALRRAGLSLAEIRQYLSAPGADVLRRVLTDCVARLEEDKRVIARTQRVLRGTLARLELLDAAESTPRFTIQRCPAEYFIQTRVPPPAPPPAAAGFGRRAAPAGRGGLAEPAEAGGRAASAGPAEPGASAEPEAPTGPTRVSEDWTLALLETVRDHLERCRRLGQEVELQMAYRIGREAFVAGDPWADFSLCSRVRGQAASVPLHVKPAGTYLKLLRRLDLDPDQAAKSAEELLFTAYDDLKRHARAEGWRIAGDAYETEISLYAGALKGLAATEIAVLVEPEPAGAAVGIE